MAYLETLYTAYLGCVLGTDAVNEMMNDASSELWNNPAVLQMSNDFAAMASNGYLTEDTGSYVFPSAQNTEFDMGTTAMYYNGSWLPNEVANITGDEFQWGAMFFPVPENAVLDYTIYSTGCQFYAAPKTAKNVEGAVKLLAEFTSVATQTELLEKCQCIPVIDGLELPTALADCSTIMAEANPNLFHSQNWSDEAYTFVTPFVPYYASETTKSKPPFRGKTVDYTHEREWRVAKDFGFQYSYVRFVVLKSVSDLERIPQDIVNEIGIEKFIFMDTYKKIEELWPTHVME